MEGIEMEGGRMEGIEMKGGRMEGGSGLYIDTTLCAVRTAG